ncbi:hypothetical protein [Rubinisphaera margarita]|uniref:hypothetical protein n=1 Tax=Rubinisphaera margarita TaxID=2909586 RepID=UPI001EE7F49E|nr:hypothetical protein [Rubinisphaera margarita]MCG6157519.1 hypothetical protein [Rubinisphaera margarita]
MGISSQFECQTCGLAAAVSGGDDVGKMTRTQTRYCSNCETLVDVCTGLHDHVQEQAHHRDEYNRCPDCREIASIAWASGEPCPRCGGTMTGPGDVIVFWD